jgi:hypothetical protein
VSFIETFLKRLDEARDEHARASLHSPRSTDAYEYGRAVGIYAGFEEARRILLDVHRDERERDDNL